MKDIDVAWNSKKEITQFGHVPFELVTSSVQKLGERVDFSIVPRHPGLLVATVRSCTVKREQSSELQIFGLCQDKCYLSAIQGGWKDNVASSDKVISG